MKLNPHLLITGMTIILCQICISAAARPKLAYCDSVSLDSTRNIAVDKISKPSTYAIKGSVADSSSKKNLDYVTINLKTMAGAPLRSTLTKADGSFAFDKVSAGTYSITIAAVGYHKKNIAVVIDSTKQITDLGKVVISEEAKQLNQVVVTADRPLVKIDVDRIAYDVQADPQSKVETVLDMLRKVPLVSVDGDDNIQVKGSSSYKILIDGRPSSLVARSPKDVFKSMPASNILRVEVITTPPAKYDSEGLAGIINIITNRRIAGGYNGSVSSRYDLFGPGASSFLSAKNNRIGFSVNGGLNWRRPRSSSFRSSRIGFAPLNQFAQTGSRAYKGNFGYVSGEVSYEIDSLNLLTASLGYNDNDGNIVINSNNENYEQNGILSQSYILNNSVDYKWGGYDLGLNYQLGFKRNKDQLLTASYKLNVNDDNQYVKNLFHGMMSPVDYLQQNESNTDEQTIQLDYAHPLKKINIEGGVKAIIRDNSSDYGKQNYDAASKTFITDNTGTNKFDYQQNVLSFYNSYQLKLNKWAAKVGLRLERTIINADFISTFSKFNTNYNNLIPSVSLQRKINQMSSINFGYTQRIQRPGILQLNPYEDIRDKFISSGNTDLKPVLNHNFDLIYNLFKKGSITTSFNYSFANNAIQSVSSLRGETTYTTYENIGKNKNLGFNLYTNYPLTNRMSVYINGRISYLWINGVVYNKFYENEGLQGYAYTYTTYRFNKDWKIGLNAGYYSPTIDLQGKSNAYYYTYANVSKDFLKKKAILTASIGNPFQEFRSWKNKISSPEFSQTKDYAQFYRQIALSFNYKFGKLKDAIKKNKRGINNDDVSGSKSRGDQ